MRKTIAALFTAFLLLTGVFAADEYKSSVLLRQTGDVYSVDYVFKVEGDGEITAVTATDSGCILEWNYIKSETRLYISLASASPISKTPKIAEVKSNVEIKLTAESLKVNGVSTEAEPLKLGDLNYDGVLNAKDVTLLRRFIVGGYNINVVEEAADVNGDDSYSIKDITVLRRYIVGGYGIELD